MKEPAVRGDGDLDFKVYEFHAEIKDVEYIDGAFIEFPYDEQREFGIKGQVKITAKEDNRKAEVKK